VEKLEIMSSISRQGVDTAFITGLSLLSAVFAEKRVIILATV
jgi:hypothetical protein